MPYQFGFNNPVQMNDPSGLEPYEGSMQWIHDQRETENNAYRAIAGGYYKEETAADMYFRGMENNANFFRGLAEDFQQSYFRDNLEGLSKLLGPAFDALADPDFSGSRMVYDKGSTKFGNVIAWENAGDAPTEGYDPGDPPGKKTVNPLVGHTNTHKMSLSKSEYNFYGGKRENNIYMGRVQGVEGKLLTINASFSDLKGDGIDVTFLKTITLGSSSDGTISLGIGLAGFEGHFSFNINRGITLGAGVSYTNDLGNQIGIDSNIKINTNSPKRVSNSNNYFLPPMFKSIPTFIY